MISCKDCLNNSSELNNLFEEIKEKYEWAKQQEWISNPLKYAIFRIWRNLVKGEISTDSFKNNPTIELSAQKAVEEYCRRRGLTILTNDYFYKLTFAQPAQPEIIHCKECKHCKHWYRDRGICFLWAENGVSVFEDGFCNYAERR